MLRYIFSDDAVSDLDAISDYLTARDPDAAVRVLSSIIAAIKRACIFPEAAPALDEPAAVPGTRKLIETDYRYVIYYRVIDRTLLVVRVFHGSQKRYYVASGNRAARRRHSARAPASASRIAVRSWSSPD